MIVKKLLRVRHDELSSASRWAAMRWRQTGEVLAEVGAKIRLAYISTDKDIWEYLGSRYSFIGFDESTFHSEYEVRNMLGRLRSSRRNCINWPNKAI